MSTPSSCALGYTESPEKSHTKNLVSWVGIAFVAVMLLNTWGGWVRLSGSGLAIPQWPILTLADGRRTLLPPMSEEDWNAAARAYVADQSRLRGLVQKGELHLADLGRTPAHLQDFKNMWWTEWLHRFLALLTGILIAGVLAVIWRSPGQRRRMGIPMTIVAGLVVLQAVIGGLLVESGSGTRWLFLHQGNSAAIVGLLVWILLTGLRQPGLVTAPSPVWPITALLTGLIWLQMVVGAMVAGSSSAQQGTDNMWRHASSDVVLMWSGNTLQGWALVLDNPVLHQGLHIWLVVAIVATTGWLAWSSRRANVGLRFRLGLGLVGTFIGLQAMLGIAGIGRSEPFIHLAHLLTAGCLLAASVLCLHDARYPYQDEPMAMDKEAMDKDPVAT